MTNIYIVSGFLGSGKTTYINSLIPTLKGKTALIENEFGEINIDAGLIKDDITIKEISDGCICCTLAINFGEAIKTLCADYKVDNIVIEPSGVALLSELVRVCKMPIEEGIDAKIYKLIVVVDASSYFEFKGEFPFYDEQIKNADEIVLTHKDLVGKEELNKIKNSIKEYNKSTRDVAEIIKETFTSVSIEKAQAKNIKSVKELIQSIESSLSDKDSKLYRIKGYVDINNQSYFINKTLSSIQIEEKEGSGLVIIGKLINNKDFEPFIDGDYLED